MTIEEYESLICWHVRQEPGINSLELSDRMSLFKRPLGIPLSIFLVELARQGRVQDRWLAWEWKFFPPGHKCAADLTSAGWVSNRFDDIGLIGPAYTGWQLERKRS